MEALSNVKPADRIAIVKEHASLVLDDKREISCLIGKSKLVGECKEHFYNFYGEQSHEHKLAHSLLNFLLIVELGYRNKCEDLSITIREWSIKEPLRTSLIEKIKHMING